MECARRWITPLLWTGTWALSLLIVVNSWHYFDALSPGAPASSLNHIPFFAERPDVTSSPMWRGAFYYHVAGAVLCLLTGPLLLSQYLLRRSVRLHRVVGWAYVVAVLVVSAPSGAYLALFAKGGFLGQLGFLLLAIAWFQSTWAGLRAIQRGDLATHRRWMHWSYAWVHSAITFRLIYCALSLTTLPDRTNYIASLWLSLVTSSATALWMNRTRTLPERSWSMKLLAGSAVVAIVAFVALYMRVDEAPAAAAVKPVVDVNTAESVLTESVATAPGGQASGAQAFGADIPESVATVEPTPPFIVRDASAGAMPQPLGVDTIAALLEGEAILETAAPETIPEQVLIQGEYYRFSRMGRLPAPRSNLDTVLEHQ